MDLDFLTVGIIWYIVFINSVVLHEVAHAYAAYKLGDSTAYDQGLVTVVPIPHIKRHIFGTVIVPIISYAIGGWMIGWASAPMDSMWVQRYPKRSAIVALSGPLTNLALMIIAGLIIHIGFRIGFFYAPDSVDFSHVTAVTAGGNLNFIATIVSIAFTLNLILFLLNLFPVPPFDGSKSILFFLNDEQASKVMTILYNPMTAIVGLIIAWNVFGYILSPIFLAAVNLTYPGVSYH